VKNIIPGGAMMKISLNMKHSKVDQIMEFFERLVVSSTE
jgi:hypothetical protein